MKICQLKPCLDDTERISEECAREPWCRWEHEILIRSHLIFREPSEAGKVDVATHGSFDAGCNETLVVTSEAVLLVDVETGGLDVIEEVIVLMQFL